MQIQFLAPVEHVRARGVRRGVGRAAAGWPSTPPLGLALAARACARAARCNTHLPHARTPSERFSLYLYVADRGHFYRAACHATAAIAKANRRGASAKSSRLLTTVTDRLAPAMTRKDDVARWSTNVAKAASAQCGWSLVSWQHYSSRF